MKDFTFEILIIDKSGKSEIQSTKSLLYGLLSTEKLWDDAKTKEDKDIQIIEDGDLFVRIKPIDTSSALYDLIESAFLIKVKSRKLEKIERFRYPLLLHLRKRLQFEHIRILTDDISTNISNEIYPLVNELENSLRRYIAKFFTQKIGTDWWLKSVPDKVIDKTKQRKNNETVFSNLVETDLTLIDFDDLGEIIYKHKLGFNKPENLIEKLLLIDDVESLSKLKEDLDSNYNRFFKQHFKDYNFDKKWKQLFFIRNKVAHNNLFVQEDLNTATKLYDELKDIINNAESKIDEFRFSVNEQEAIREAVSGSEKEYSDEGEINQPRVVGKIDLNEFEDREHDYLIIDEETFLGELDRAQRSLQYSHLTYVGLKSFVTKLLGSKGYSYGPTYALVNILKDKGIVEIYDVDDDASNWPVKAIKLNK